MCYARKNDFDDVFYFIERLSKKERHMMKENPYFFGYGKKMGSKFESMNYDHWWDIENDFMFWRKKKCFNKKFLNAIGFKGEIK